MSIFYWLIKEICYLSTLLIRYSEVISYIMQQYVLQNSLGFRKNGRLEGGPIVSTYHSCNTCGLTSPGSLNTCPICEGQRWMYDVLTILLGFTGPPCLDLNLKDPAIKGLKAFCRLFFNLAQPRLDLPTACLTFNCATLTRL